MQELEKILEEIKESSIIVATSKEHYIHPQDGRFVEEVVLLDCVEDIICKHMNDGWIPVEKQKPKKRIYPKTALERYYHAPECPNCKRELKPRICGYTLSQAIGIYSYCPWCGQNLEGVEESEE